MRPDSIEPFHQVAGDEDRICTDKTGRPYHTRQCVNKDKAACAQEFA